MKLFLTSFLVLVSANVLANTKPCLTQATQAVFEKISDITEESDCEVKLSKVHQSNNVVTYKANISCVDAGGFLDISEIVVMKYKKLDSGGYSCHLQ